jgi:hypothetical protein
MIITVENKKQVFIRTLMLTAERVLGLAADGTVHLVKSQYPADWDTTVPMTTPEHQYAAYRFYIPDNWDIRLVRRKESPEEPLPQRQLPEFSGEFRKLEERILKNTDPELHDLLTLGGDVYRHLAAKMFGVAYEDVTEEQRSRAKTIAYKRLYGGNVENTP